MPSTNRALSFCERLTCNCIGCWQLRVNPVGQKCCYIETKATINLGDAQRQWAKVCLDGVQWNDGLLATVRERVHMAAERKAMQMLEDTNMPPGLPFHEKITYKVGTKDEDVQLDATRARFSKVLKRHSELTERLSRDSDKMIFERLQKEFDAARASQTQEVCLDGEQWNDGLLATVRERVHIEAERKAMQMPEDTNMPPGLPFHEKITYKVGTKLICCLEGARIGIQYETSFAGEPCEVYHCVLESKSFLEKMTVLEHTIPFFLPIRDAENDLLSSNAMKFIDHVGDLLQAYVDRREQIRLIKELYGNQIGELYHSLPYHMIEFVLDDFDCKVTVSLRYADLLSILPTRISVVAWPMPQSKKSPSTAVKKGTAGSQALPIRLSYAEDALRTMSLPEAYAEIVLNLPEALQQIHTSKDPS